MAEAKTREQREAEWWAAWRAEDFSWDGLADKEWQGWTVTPNGFVVQTANGRRYGVPPPDGEVEAAQPTIKAEGHAATLQDYWRADPETGRLRTDVELGDELVRDESGETRYHRCHLPLTFADGTLTGKADWRDDELDALVYPRLLAAAEIDWQSIYLVGVDHRAKFQGGVWLRAAAAGPQLSPVQLIADYEWSFFAGYADFSTIRFSCGAYFQFANFSAGADFESATINGAAWFRGSAFRGDAKFDSAAFSGDATFQFAAFSGRASFESSSFTNDAKFEFAAFSGFAGFNGATFSGDASFDGANFSSVALFESANFSGDASFDGANFSSVALFESANFSGDTGFESAKFAGQAKFGLSCFAKAAHFDQCLFNEKATFDGATFQGDISFTAAIFEKLASFEGLTWPEQARHWHSAFDQTLFRSTLVLKESGFCAFAAFDGATLERGIQLDEVTEKEADTTFKREHKLVAESAILDGQDFKARENEVRQKEHKDAARPVKRSEVKAFVCEMRDVRLRELERGCRVLKLAMEQSSNKTCEQLLYRFELQARRAQRNLPFGEKTFSYLYAAASDYGASMWRPFAALAILIAAFAGIFFGWAFALSLIGAGDGQIIPGTAAWQALDLSWANVFKPLSALTSDIKQDGTLGDALLEYHPGVGFAVRAVATVQSLFAIVLAFLFALAVRRRFQIS